jgi:uncharacterized protein
MNKLILLFFIFSFFIISNLFPQQKLDSYWKGKISIMAMDIGIEINFKTDADSIRGKMDIPEQNAKDLSLIHISFKEPKVYFELQAGPGVAIFDGEIKADSIFGKYLQAGMEGTFVIRKSADKPKDITPKDVEILPYKQEEVTFNNGDIKFAGTLTLPEKSGKHPVIIMITGSGPQNRDEELLGFKPFKVIADYLTRNGIAVLRYDDRGVGGSTGKSTSESTTEEFSTDVLAAVDYLKTRNDINIQQIGLFGHSEGGIVAPLVASKSADIAFIICMAGTGVTGEEIVTEQSKLIMQANNTSDEDIEKNQNVLKKVFTAIKNNSSFDEIKDEIKKSLEEEYNKMTDEQKKTIPDKEEYFKSTVDAQIKQINNPWFKYFTTYDPKPSLKNVKCPVLLLFGELDLQVPPHQNKEPMEKALKEGGNTNFKTIVFPKANHLFQSATNGSPNEYAKLPKEFVPGFLDEITKWVLERVEIVK